MIAIPGLLWAQASDREDTGEADAEGVIEEVVVTQKGVPKRGSKRGSDPISPKGGRIQFPTDPSEFSRRLQLVFVPWSLCLYDGGSVMPRPPRLNLPGIPQHVTQRGNNRQACFFDDQDRVTYLSLVGAAAVRRSCAIHAYVLMTNHVHLLVTPANPDGVSRLMQDIGREYVRQVNARYRRSGTLWEGRFKSSLVDSERYCLICYRYIELNPVRANIVLHPADYRWSSYAANARGMADPLLTPHPQWRALGPDQGRRCRAYRELFACGPQRSELEAIRRSNRKGLPLGSDAFRENIEAELGIRLGNRKVGRPGKRK